MVPLYLVSRPTSLLQNKYSSTVDCPIGTTQQDPCLQVDEYMVRGRHKGGCPRGSLFRQLCGSLGPCSIPASYTSPPALSFLSLPDVFPV